MDDQEVFITPTGAEITRLTTSLEVGRPSRNLNGIVLPAQRPIGGLLISSRSVLNAETRDDQFLATWEQLAYLHGQLAAFRDLLSPQLADQWDAWSRQSYDRWIRVVAPLDV